ncbi:phosphatidylglycerophosphatase A [Massilicoli timonensis]|uniref:phosphatidylglycerophosphatase A family protein n=1 Tax=Massilicoli timonensis TaxID=2015901 RepID=UPI003AAE56CA
MYMKCVGLLEKRGVRREDIAECVLFLQKQYIEDLHIAQCLKMVDDVLHKREVQHAIITAIELDRSAEQGSMIDQDLRHLLMQDAPLYGIDEVLAYGICHLYGSIAITNFGYIDKVKPGIIGKLNTHQEGVCHTFLDDIVGAIAAAAAGKLAHGNSRSEQEG